MTLSVTNHLLFLLLLTTGLGVVIGACLMRLFALRRLQRHYEQWRLGLLAELRDQRGAAGGRTRGNTPVTSKPISQMTSLTTMGTTIAMTSRY